MPPARASRSPTWATGVTSVPVRTASVSELERTSRDRGLGFDSAELARIRGYFRRERRDPTDVELAGLAQSWSEHCSYKSSRPFLRKAFGSLHSRPRVLGTGRRRCDAVRGRLRVRAPDRIAQPPLGGRAVRGSGHRDRRDPAGRARGRGQADRAQRPALLRSARPPRRPAPEGDQEPPVPRHGGHRRHTGLRQPGRGSDRLWRDLLRPRLHGEPTGERRVHRFPSAGPPAPEPGASRRRSPRARRRAYRPGRDWRRGLRVEGTYGTQRIRISRCGAARQPDHEGAAHPRLSRGVRRRARARAQGPRGRRDRLSRRRARPCRRPRVEARPRPSSPPRGGPATVGGLDLGVPGADAPRRAHPRPPRDHRDLPSVGRPPHRHRRGRGSPLRDGRVERGTGRASPGRLPCCAAVAPPTAKSAGSPV